MSDNSIVFLNYFHTIEEDSLENQIYYPYA